MRRLHKFSLNPDPEDFYIPFAAATFAVGISQKRVRNWLDREQVYFDANEQREESGKHRRFTELDCIRIGIVGRLTRYGFSPERASDIVEEMFIKLPSAAEFTDKTSIRDKVIGGLQVAIVTFWYDEDEEEDRYALYDSRKREPKEVRRFDARLTLNISQMVSTMWTRLEAAGLLDEKR
jgi:hypothetical protein